jgi:phosphoadenosine phosphosulfate reductase
VIDMLSRLRVDARIFTLDTGRLHEETYEVMEAIRRRYGLAIETHFPDRDEVERLERSKGFYSFRDSIENRRECCNIRKVAPLGRALAGLDAWITGLRREQAVTRGDLPKVDWGARQAKLNPLADWSLDRVWSYVRDNDIPYNKLYDRGFPSIGCSPCTRAVRPGEDLRAGRWWWEQPEQKECGLHVGGNGSNGNGSGIQGITPLRGPDRSIRPQ